MIISARVHYASLAMLELAMRQGSRPVSVSEMTQRHGIPGPFLVQILRSLRAAGWVQSTRGSQGGYRLTASPADITLLDIAEALGCQETAGERDTNGTPADDVLQEYWDNASEASRRVLSQARLSDLMEKCGSGDAMMFYI